MCSSGLGCGCAICSNAVGWSVPPPPPHFPLAVEPSHLCLVICIHCWCHGREIKQDSRFFVKVYSLNSNARPIKDRVGFPTEHLTSLARDATSFSERPRDPGCHRSIAMLAHTANKRGTIACERNTRYAARACTLAICTRIHVGHVRGETSGRAFR